MQSAYYMARSYLQGAGDVNMASTVRSGELTVHLLESDLPIPPISRYRHLQETPRMAL